jgi:hypothetical protein
VSWRVLGASVRGVRHAREGTPCQDAHAWRALPDGRVAFAVADGAGSAAHADAGAGAAARAAVDAVADAAGRGGEVTAALDGALDAALAAVEAEAGRLGTTAGELATTLIVGVAARDGVAAAQVGDGALVVEDAAGIQAITVPVSGEFINETVFLTSPGALQGAQRATWRGAPLHLAAFSDGLQELALRRPDHAPHAPFFTPLFRFAGEAEDVAGGEAELAAFLASPRVTARADDDLTLLLVTRPHE